MKKADFERTRRLFIGGGAATVVALYLAAVGRGAVKPCGGDALPNLADLRPFIRLGNAYLAELLARGESAFLEELNKLRPLKSNLRADSIGCQLQAIGRQVEEDFERGDTVSCDGWVLARSEARLCAATAMLCGDTSSLT